MHTENSWSLHKALLVIARGDGTGTDFRVCPAYSCDGAVYVTTLPCTHSETRTVSFQDAVSHFDDTLLPFSDEQTDPSA